MHVSEIRDDKLYYIKTLRLRILGKYLKSRSFLEMIRSEIRRVKEEKNHRLERPHLEYAFCYSDNPPAYLLSLSDNGVQQLVRKLGLPQVKGAGYASKLFAGAELVAPSSSREFEKYSVEAFGLGIKLPHPLPSSITRLSQLAPSQYTCLPKYYEEFPWLLVQVWRLRVFNRPIEALQNSPYYPVSDNNPPLLYFEECWHPQEGIRRALGGLEHLRNSQTSFIGKFIDDSLFLTRNTERPVKNRGRHKKYPTANMFYSRLTQALSELSDIEKENPTEVEVAEQMNISSATFKRRLNDFGLTWETVLQKKFNI
jgi:hypothetical protein